MHQKSLKLPKIIAGTSNLGNLYKALTHNEKLAIVKSVVEFSDGVPVFDTAGKYGAGLALESIGKCLKDLNVKPDEVIISNKLGWLRMPLVTDEPTFEKGVWRDLEFDAYQDISYDGMIKCYEQGLELLGGYKTQMLSVHDPDEYLNAAIDEEDKKKRFNDILEAYKALEFLKSKGEILGIGIGSKDWKTIKEISQKVDLDWVMFANSLTIHSHPPELIDFIEDLDRKGIYVINSAVFNGGFLTGSDYYNYQLTDEIKDADLYSWRSKFYDICAKHNLTPAEVCVYFGLNVNGVKSIALSSSSASRTAKNMQFSDVKIPSEFWTELKNNNLLEQDYPLL